MKPSETHLVECMECEGYGMVEFYDGDESSRSDCGVCDGNGKIEKDVFDCECEQCQECFYIVQDSNVLGRHADVISAIISATSMASKNINETCFEVIKGVWGDNVIYRTWGNEWQMKTNKLLENIQQEAA